MSVYILDPETFKTLALFAVSKKHNSSRVYPYSFEQYSDKPLTDPQTAADFYANLLFNENVRSVKHYYPESDSLPGPIDLPGKIIMPLIRPISDADPIQILKTLDSLEYQSCETEDWEETPACMLVNAIRKAAVHDLPGYEEAEWS